MAATGRAASASVPGSAYEGTVRFLVTLIENSSSFFIIAALARENVYICLQVERCEHDATGSVIPAEAGIHLSFRKLCAARDGGPPARIGVKLAIIPHPNGRAEC